MLLMLVVNEQESLLDNILAGSSFLLNTWTVPKTDSLAPADNTQAKSARNRNRLRQKRRKQKARYLSSLMALPHQLNQHIKYCRSL